MPYVVRLPADMEEAKEDRRHPYWKRRSNPRLSKRLKAVIELLEQHPFDAAGSHPLHYNLAGLRAATLVLSIHKQR